MTTGRINQVSKNQLLAKALEVESVNELTSVNNCAMQNMSAKNSRFITSSELTSITTSPQLSRQSEKIQHATGDYTPATTRCETLNSSKVQTQTLKPRETPKSSKKLEKAASSTCRGCYKRVDNWTARLKHFFKRKTYAPEAAAINCRLLPSPLHEQSLLSSIAPRDTNPQRTCSEEMVQEKCPTLFPSFALNSTLLQARF